MSIMLTDWVSLPASNEAVKVGAIASSANVLCTYTPDPMKVSALSVNEALPTPTKEIVFVAVS